MENQQEKFAAIFFDAYPHLNTEDRRLLAGMASLWSNRPARHQPTHFVVSTTSIARRPFDGIS